MKKVDTPPEKSAGLQFIEAAARAMPKTIGDRERISAMNTIMTTAIKARFPFGIAEADALSRFGIRRCVGLFAPLDFYALGCICGGTYARMIERHRNLEPWMAARAIAPVHSEWQGKILEKNRVAEGVGVLINAPDPDGVDLPRFDGCQVWWCTSANRDTIVLCRYPVRVNCRNVLAYEGTPVKRMKLSRQEWKKLNTPVTEAQAA